MSFLLPLCFTVFAAGLVIGAVLERECLERVFGLLFCAVCGMALWLWGAWLALWLHG